MFDEPNMSKNSTSLLSTTSLSKLIIREVGSPEYRPKNEKYVKSFSNYIQNLVVQDCEFYNVQRETSIKEIRLEDWIMGTDEIQYPLFADKVE